ncbi:sensor histidine kinase [Fibrella forsythiae]|uniref:Histidine kinase n=1 Tax=Fibrella forsythiae TaxID=2817061 RepID=A0ABS3JRI3_9BACT|nr:sensor histidine kinase [Fibrella forsythiae]MBO0952598.1 histidine kinase [Fibrella forsythiae]
MTLKTPARYLVLLQFIIIPLYIGLFNWILIGNTYWQNWITFGVATGVLLLLAVINFNTNKLFVKRMRRTVIEPEQYMAKTLRKFIVTATCSSLFFGTAFFIYQWIHLPGYVPDPLRLALGVLFTIIVDAVITVSYESIDNFGQWQQSRQEVETLSKAQLQAQLDALRQQVNPHFLFNSLNSLISLIDEDPRQASTFAEELSTVYRYLLRSNDSILTSLASELEFIQSYYHLLKTRHGDALTLETQIQPGAEGYQLPPLTLQLLIENAVKHNVALPDQPLTISLTSNGNQLIVSNNLQRKPQRVLSNGVGLSNILTRYQALGDLQPMIEDDGREFRVTLPLL